MFSGGMLGLGLVTLYSYVIFGQPLPAAGYNVEGLGGPLSSPSAFARNFSDWLVAPGRGLLIFVPVLVVALPDLARVLERSPPWVRVAALAGVAYAFTQVSLIRASGGTFFFGHRTTLEMLVLISPFVLLALRTWWDRGVIARIVLVGVVAMSVVLHAYGAYVSMPDRAEQVLHNYQEQTGP